MANYTYYLFNLVVVVPVLAAVFFTPLKVRMRLSMAIRAFLLVWVPFVVWDAWATRQGHWSFNEKYVASQELFGLPVEELLFFVTVPFACLYVWSAIKKLYKNTAPVGEASIQAFAVLSVAVSALLLSVFWRHGYTQAAALTLLATTGLLLWQWKLVRRRHFWVFQGIVLLLFVAFNTFLTALPVVMYGEQAITGFRIGTIPIEDFIFNFVLSSILLLALDKK